MNQSLSFVVNIWMKLLFIFTPFLVMSIFMGLTAKSTDHERKKLALQATIAIGAICFFIFFFGQAIFSLFGITLDAFRIGAGALLFLSAINLVQGRSPNVDDESDGFIVVPYAMPIVVGPATIGILFVLSADAKDSTERFLTALAIALAVLCLGLLLIFSSAVERAVGQKTLRIFSKTTGIILAALASQMIFTGAGAFFGQ